MKKAFLSLFFLFFVLIGFGQANLKLDSLKRVLAKLPAEGKFFVADTIRVNILCELGEEFKNIKSDSAFHYGNGALKTAIELNYKKGQIKSYMLLGNYYSNQSLTIKATENNLKALAIAEELNLYKDQILLTTEIGTDFLSLMDFKNANFYYSKNEVLSKKYGTFENYVFSLNNLGILFFEQRNFKKALEFFLKCEEISKASKKPKFINLGLINIAKVYVELGNLDKAVDRYNLAIKTEDGFLDREAFINNELALIFFQREQYSKALTYAKRAFFQSKKLNNIHSKNIAQTLSKIYEKLGNEKEALKYYKMFTEISLNQDSVKNIQLVRFMNLDYQNEKQLFKIEGLNNDVRVKETQNKFLFFAGICAITIMFIALFFYFSIKKKNRLIENQKSEIQDLNQNLEYKIKERTEELSEANKELIKKNFEITEALFKGKTMERERVAAELHDNLGSTLTALKWRLSALDSDQLKPAERKIYESIKESMNDAYGEVRNISHNLIPKELIENGLLGAIMKLVDGINSSSKIVFQIKAKSEILTNNKNLIFELYNIILELTTNVLKHSNASQAVLELNQLYNKIEILVMDNGTGVDPKNINGKGLNNIKERLKRINGELNLSYNEEYKTIYSITIVET